VLYFIEGYKQAEIAKMLDTTEAAVKVNVHRAKNRLSAIIMAQVAGISLGHQSLKGRCTIGYFRQSYW